MLVLYPRGKNSGIHWIGGCVSHRPGKEEDEEEGGGEEAGGGGGGGGEEEEGGGGGDDDDVGSYLMTLRKRGGTGNWKRALSGELVSEEGPVVRQIDDEFYVSCYVKVYTLSRLPEISAFHCWSLDAYKGNS